MAKPVPALLALLLGPAQILAAQELGTISGTVRDTAGTALAGAEVLIGNKRQLTTPQGQFRIDSVTVGNHLLTVRLVGYSALRASVAVRAGLNPRNVVLQPAAQSLPTLSVEARRTGLYGTVGDSTFAPLAGATVQVAGRGGGEAVTDSAGRFAFPRASEGQYAVRIVLPGYAQERHFVELKKDEGMELAFRLRSSFAMVPAMEQVAIQELGRRLVTNLRSDRLNAGQLVRYGSLGICDLPGFVTRLRIPAAGITIILNGTVVLEKMDASALCSWRASDVELVEFGDTVCRDATRTLVDLLNVWCTTLTRRRNDSDPSLSLRERVRALDNQKRGIERIQPPGGPFVAIWERR